MKLLDITKNDKIIILESREEILNSDYFKLIERLNIEGGAKFAVVLKDNKYYAMFFKLLTTHSDVAIQLYENQFNFVGAGFISMDKENYCVAFFNSESCKSKFGFDTPVDENLKKAILDNLENAFKNLFEIFS